jgi:ribosomal protein S18 acetylase RimI-like enzyme
VALHSGQQQRVRVSDLDSQTIGRFEVLTASTLAARYPRKFYKHLLVQIKKQEVIAKLAWWPGNYRAVACVCCHIEPVQRRLLIMTLSTIPTYRRRGVATELMRSVIESARALSPPLPGEPCRPPATFFRDRFGIQNCSGPVSGWGA